jgi:putative SOS response-associated peptidase YedK
MCGRYASTRSAADLTALFEAVDEIDPAGGITPRYNVAPTDPAPFVRISRQRGGRALAVGRWGLLPHWARDPRQAARMINARAETVATAPAYASAFATRRALVPADGWYEWRRLDGRGKQAYFMTPADGSPLAFAGLWSRWGTEGLLTFCVITVPASGELAAVHDRMPLVLPPSRWQRWLADEAPALDPPPAGLLADLELRPVGPAVGNVRNDGPELVTRVDVLEAPADTASTLF